MLRFHYSLAPNPMKVALFLEEAGLEYEAVPVDTRQGEQHAAAFTVLNPNAKVPVIEDGDAVVFDSNAILLYLAEKTGRFLPEAARAPGRVRGELLSWLMFVASGVGPYAGQMVHFSRFAPEPREYAVTRYAYEARRHFGLLDAHLGTREFMLGSEYSLLDMAVWGWARMVPFVLGDEAWGGFDNLRRLKETVSARPAAQRAEAIKERHAFKAEMDDAARAVMFRHTVAAQ